MRAFHGRYDPVVRTLGPGSRGWSLRSSAYGPYSRAYPVERTRHLTSLLQVQETLKAYEEVASSFQEGYIPGFKAASGYTKNRSRMKTPSLHCILFPNAGTWFFNTPLTP